MKRLITILVSSFIVFIIFFDLKKGTLNFSPPTSSVPAASVKVSDDIPYKKIEVYPGATVLSITERIHNNTIPVPIEKLVNDFKHLNSDISPQKIQVGKTYKFPLYKNSLQK